MDCIIEELCILLALLKEYSIFGEENSEVVYILISSKKNLRKMG